MGYQRGSVGVNAGTANTQAPRLMDEARHHLRLKHDSLRTEQAYVGWIRRYVRANGKRHPRALGGAEVEHLLSDLATAGAVSGVPTHLGPSHASGAATYPAARTR